jgi:hypothetical protein
LSGATSATTGPTDFQPAKILEKSGFLFLKNRLPIRRRLDYNIDSVGFRRIPAGVSRNTLS